MSKNETFSPQEVQPAAAPPEAPRPPSLLPEPGHENQTLNLLRQMNHQQKQLDQKYGLPEDLLGKGSMDNMPHPPDARNKASDADAHKIAEMLKDGKISDDEKKKITEIVLKGLDNHSLGDLTAKVNKDLKAAGSSNELHIDDSMANVKDVGKVTVSVCDANSHSCFDGFVIPINNMPKIPMPPGRDGIKR